MELLLSQDRVVSLLYTKTFPSKPATSRSGSRADSNDVLPSPSEEERNAIFAGHAP